MLSVRQLIEISAPSCRARDATLKILRTKGLEEAIEFLRIIPGTNLETLRLINDSMDDKEKQ